MTTASVSFTVKNGSAPFTIPTALTRKTVLYFMRAATCAQCNRHTRDLEKMSTQLKNKDLDTIIIVPEDATTAEKVKERNRLRCALWLVKVVRMHSLDWTRRRSD